MSCIAAKIRQKTPYQNFEWPAWQNNQYDGLKEYNQPGYGVRYQATPTPPSRYMKSHGIYLKLDLLKYLNCMNKIFQMQFKKKSVLFYERIWHEFRFRKR